MVRRSKREQQLFKAAVLAFRVVVKADLENLKSPEMRELDQFLARDIEDNLWEELFAAVDKIDCGEDIK